MKVKTANLQLNSADGVKPDQSQYMGEPINGFTIRAGDNSGKCYAVKNRIQALTGGTEVTDIEQSVIDGTKEFLNVIDDL